MQDIITSLTNQDVPLALLIMLMIFMLGVALFHTLIFSGLYNINLRPNWLFFVLNPLILLVVWLINSHYSILVLIIMFISVFLFGIIGMIYSAVTDKEETYDSNGAFRKKYDIKTKKKFNPKDIIIAIAAIGLAIFLFSKFHEGGIILWFGLIFLIAFASPSQSKRFLKMQANLPTSKARSVAMGLAELQGKAVVQQLLSPPIGKKNCIGFHYTVENVSTDKDGKDSYTTVLSQTLCNDFLLKDDTGTIQVKGENIELVWLEIDERYNSGRQRFTQYILEDQQDILLVGNVSLDQNTPIIGYDNYHKTFAVSPSDKINIYNDARPLINQAKVFCALFLLIIALILITPMSLSGNKLIIEKPKLLEKLTLKPILTQPKNNQNNDTNAAENVESVEKSDQ